MTHADVLFAYMLLLWPPIIGGGYRLRVGLDFKSLFFFCLNININLNKRVRSYETGIHRFNMFDWCVCAF